jgi:hypothetical protein
MLRVSPMVLMFCDASSSGILSAARYISMNPPDPSYLPNLLDIPFYIGTTYECIVSIAVALSKWISRN